MDIKGFERLQTALQWVADDERSRDAHLGWDQGLWAYGTATSILPAEEVAALGFYGDLTIAVTCPTSCCVAGNVVVANGDTLLANALPFTQAGDVVSADYCVSEDGKRHQIVSRATDLLGITEDEAESLFDGDNDSHDLHRIGKRIAENHGYELEIL